MKTLKFFAITCIVCKAALLNAQTNNLIASNSIITKPDGSGYALAVQPDEKILVGGSSPGKNSNDLTVVRYNADGSIDKDFGKNGKAIAKFGGNSEAYSIALQPDGKIVAAGTAHDDFAVTRFNADGSVDSSFGKKGKVALDFEGYQDQLNYIALQPDTKILAVGTGFDSNNDWTSIVLIRFNADGSFDKSFGTRGVTAIHVNVYSSDYGKSIILKQDGKILVAGYSYNVNTQNDFTLIQFNSDGKVDSSYGTDGHIYTDISGFDLAWAAAVQSNGKIIVTGYSGFFDSKFILAGYTKDGLPDSSFGTDGKVITTVGGIDDKAYSLSVQPDNKIVVAGYSFNGSNTDFAIVRYKKNGALDKSFGDKGKVITDVNGGDDEAHAVSVLQNGKILMAGSSAGRFALAWYNENGSQLINNGSAAIASLIIKNNSLAPGIKIYPNPVKDVIAINGLNPSHTTALSVIDAAGKTVMQTSVHAGNYLWNIKQLHTGIYYLRIDLDISDKGNTKNLSVKFMKE